MTRMQELEARRVALLQRCAEQRVELGARIAFLREAPLRWLRGTGGAGEAGFAPSRHPLGWIAALGGLLLFGRTRQVLTGMVWARSALGLVSKIAQVATLFAALRRTR
jgi:hypothetical protein